jgi:tetratricopeptide (TPR) repeat protein
VAQQEVLDLLCNLVDKSLVLVEDQGISVRYGMLETVRQYGLRMLSEEGELEESRQRHAAFFIQLAERADEGLRDARQVVSLDVLDTEHDNLRGALRWATDNNEKDMALRLVGALGWFWFMRGHWQESWRWFHVVNDLESDCNPLFRVKAICRAGGLEIIRGNMIGTVELVEEAIDICRELGDEEGLAWSLNLKGQVKTWFGETAQAISYLSESAELFSSLENDWGVAFSQRYIGQMEEFRGEYERGIDFQKEALAIFEQVGDVWNQAHSLFLLGGTATRHNDYPLAEWALEQCLEKCAIIEDKVMEAHALRGLGQLALQKDDREHMEEIYLEALEALQKIGDESCVASVLKGLGEVAKRKGDYDKAAKLLAQSLLAYKKLGLDYGVVWLIDRFAALAAVFGKRERVVRLLGASKDLEGKTGRMLPLQDREERENLTASMRELVGVQTFAVLFEEGAAMNLEDAAAYALENGLN